MFSIKNCDPRVLCASGFFAITNTAALYCHRQASHLRTNVEDCTLRVFNSIVQNPSQTFHGLDSDKRLEAMDSIANKYCKELIDLQEGYEKLTHYATVLTVIGVVATYIFVCCCKTRAHKPMQYLE